MPTLNITNDQFLTALQNIQSRYIKLELLNYQFQTVDELSGLCTAGSFQIDANSDIRRTGSITLVIKDSSFHVESGGKIFLDRFIRVNVGTESIRTGEIVWSNLGIYIIDAPSYNYNATTNTLTLSLLDLMAKLTGIRNGYLKGIPTVLKKGENIRKAIIDTLALAGFNNYIVEEAPDPGTLPIDLEFGQGSTIYDLLSGLRDIYPNHEIYFDVDGVFYYKKIPTGEDDPILVDDTLFESIVESEQITVNFQNVKNSIEVYGRTHDPEHFSTDTKISGNVINLTMASVSEYAEDVIYGFTLKDNTGYKDMQLKINSLATLPIKLEDGKTNAEIKAENGEIYYCVQYKKTYWRWLGHLQAYGFAEDDNPNSPFYVEGTVGRIRLPLYGGEYENCLTDELAQTRAEYELYLHSKMNDTITLNCVPVYWMDVNIKARYTANSNQQTDEYIIKNIGFGLGQNENMTMTLMKFYPLEGI